MDQADREEDAANLFGHFLVRYCRSRVLAALPRNTSDEARRAIQGAVDDALHGLTDLLEGYWPLPAGRDCSAEFTLNVDIVRAGELIERLAISPARVDLPIGFWSWIEP